MADQLVKFEPSHRYRGQVYRVVDGDTVEVLLDLGFDAWSRVALRIAELWAPERNVSAGKEAQAVMADLLPVGTPIAVYSTQRRSFARYVGELWVHRDGALRRVSDVLIGRRPDLFSAARPSGT